MVQINHAQRELTLKVVYYGPALSGKTTNLMALHQQMDSEQRGRLLSVDTRDDRTLFFDMLPVYFRSATDFRVKLKLYTVPGQVMHAATRRLVLQNADAVAFIADAQRNASQVNNEAWRNMLDDMRANGLNPDTIPLVIQFNKMDLPDARSEEELLEIASKGPEPIYRAVAVRGEGVMETLHGLLRLTWRALDRDFGLETRHKLGEAEFLAGIFQGIDIGDSRSKPALVPAGGA